MTIRFLHYALTVTLTDTRPGIEQMRANAKKNRPKSLQETMFQCIRDKGGKS